MRLRPKSFAKEPYERGNRALFVTLKIHTRKAKEPYSSRKRVLFIMQKSPIHYEKDPHSLRKRALRNIVCARMRRVFSRPIHSAKESQTSCKRTLFITQNPPHSKELCEILYACNGGACARDRYCTVAVCVAV